MADICPLRPKCLSKPPSNGTRSTDQCRFIAELPPEALAFVDAQKVLAHYARNLSLCRVPMQGRQHTGDLLQPALRPCTPIRRQHFEIGGAAELIEQAGAPKSELIMHDDIQCRTRQSAHSGSGQIAAEDGIHMIARHLKQAHEFTHIVAAIAVGTRHADQIDRMRLCLLPPCQKQRQRGARCLVPTVGKAAGKAARIEGDDWAGDPRAARNRLNIVADEPCRTAADNRKQCGRLLHIGSKGLVQILLRTEDNRIIVKLRTEHTMGDRRLTVLNVTHGKEMAPEGTVDDDHRILDPRKKCRCPCQRTGIRTHTDIVEGFFAIIHRSALPCSRADAESAAYHPADDAPWTSRPMAAAQGRAGAASYRRVHVS